MTGTSFRLDGPLLDIKGNSLSPRPPFAIVFWATWCGPCDIELGRIQSLIQKGKIKSQQVIAVSVDENSHEVEKALRERGYLFPVVWDRTHGLRNQFQVAVTPTVVVINPENRIEWFATGVSPTLERRLERYLKSSAP